MEQGEDVRLSRSERRDKSRWLEKQLEVHMRKKPGLMNGLDPEDDSYAKEMNDHIAKVRAWATRYGIIVRQLDELGYGTKKHSKKLHKQSIEHGRAAQEELKDNGSVKVGDMSLVPDTKSKDDVLSEG